MEKIYYELVKAGRKAINDVPEKNGLREKVQVMLDADEAK